MKFYLLLPLFWGLCHAEDFTLADGTVLHDATLLRRSDEDIQVRHSAGVQRFRYDALSPELQVRFEMTPEQVEARRRAAQDAREEQLRLKRKEQEEQRSLLEASSAQPRYLSGGDVATVFSELDQLSMRQAEYLAAEWNRREARRFRLPLEEDRFTEDAAALRGSFAAEREQRLRNAQSVDSLRAKISELQSLLQQKEDLISRLGEENARLRKELDAARAFSSTQPTTVISRPVYVPTPVYVPRAPALRPPGPPQPSRPAPRPRPVPYSRGAGR